MVLSNAQWFANPGEAAYEIDYSCRFNDDDTAYLQWATTDTPTSTDIGTISVWLKRGNLGITNTRVWNKGDSGTPMLELIFMNTVKDCEYEDTNKLFNPPTKFDVRITKWINEDQLFSSLEDFNLGMKDIENFSNELMQRLAKL